MWGYDTWQGILNFHIMRWSIIHTTQCWCRMGFGCSSPCLTFSGLIAGWLLLSASVLLAVPATPQFWVYSLVGTNYDGYRMLPHFLDHYRNMGVADDHFHFDLLHDPAEPDVGIKVVALLT